MRKKVFGCIKQKFLQMIMNKLAYETYEKYQDRDRDRDRNFRDRGHALPLILNGIFKLRTHE